MKRPRLLREELEFPIYNVGYTGKYINGNLNVIPINAEACRISPCEEAAHWNGKEMEFVLVAVLTEDGTFESLNYPDGFDLSFVIHRYGKRYIDDEKVEWYMRRQMEKEAIKVANNFYQKCPWAFELASQISTHNTIVAAREAEFKTEVGLMKIRHFLKMAHGDFDKDKMRKLFRKRRRQDKQIAFRET